MRRCRIVDRRLPLCGVAVLGLFFSGCNKSDHQTATDRQSAKQAATELENSNTAAETTEEMTTGSPNTTSDDTSTEGDTDTGVKKKKYVFGSEIDPDEPCAHCEQRFCTKINGENFVDQCTNGKNAALCKQVVACAADTKCATEKSADCYCGADADIGKCMVEGGDGPCKDLIEKASESKKPSEIAARFGNPAFTIGRAVAWIDCKTRYCPKCNR